VCTWGFLTVLASDNRASQVGPTGEFLEFFTSSVTAAEIAKRIKGHIHSEVGAVHRATPENFGDFVKSQLAIVGRFFRS
jgi:hypothetical protein